MEHGWEEARWERLATGCARRRLPGLDATVGVVVGTDGMLVVDTGSTLAEGAALRRDLHALTGRPATHVALTHGHFDHVFGTAAFAGVEVIGARGLGRYLRRNRDELCADAVRHGVDPEQAAVAADALVLPRTEVGDRLEIDLGGRPVVLARPGTGHTGHDLAVLVPGTPPVLFCGDLVEESGPPQDGWDAEPRQWPATLDALLELGGETALYVPGHGAVVDARFVRAQREELARRFGVP